MTRTKLQVRKSFTKNMRMFKTSKFTKSEQTFLFIPGLHFPSVDTKCETTNDSEYKLMQIVTNETDIDSHYFNYFTNSIYNLNPKKMKIKDFYEDLIIVIKFLEKEYKEIIPISMSFGSILLLLLSEAKSKKIKRSFLCGPTSPSDHVGIFKFRAKDEYFLGTAISYSKVKKNDFLIKFNLSNQKWIDKRKINSKINFHFIRGENENVHFIESIDKFIKDNLLDKNNLSVLPDCGHVIYNQLVDDKKIFKIFINIIKSNI